MNQTPHNPTAAPPPRHHRRAHSDTSFLIDDLLLLDPSEFDLSALDSLPAHSPSPMAVDISSDDSSSNGGAFLNPAGASATRHVKSLSVDSDFFEGLGFGGEMKGMGFAEVTVDEERKVRHRRSESVDGLGVGLFDADARKGVSKDKLAELALIDPKRAKRILANRQSAQRSKERKTRYTYDLERKVQTLQTEATTLSAKLTMMKKDASGLTTENRELKLHLQAMEQQSKLKEALNETLRGELQQLKIAVGEIAAVNGNPLYRGFPRYSPLQQALHPLGMNQIQQQQQRNQLHIP